MFCIAAFIVFAVLAIFSASFRPLAAKAWHCVVRRVTFRPCDITFGEEMKGKLVGKLIFTHPRLARFLNRWIDWLSFAFVVLSIWSVFYVALAGLNIWVYDTCDPRSAESCSLSGEACGIDQATLGLMQAVREQRMIEWSTGPLVRFSETLSRIPDRVRSWNPQEYLSPTKTFYRPYDASKPYALEVIDPSCTFCKKLTNTMKKSGAMERYNVSYVLYPIPNHKTGGTKFPHSMMMASYIEATKQVPLTHGDTSVPPDWQLLSKLFADSDTFNVQEAFNLGMTRTEAEKTLHKFLRDIGYTPQQINRIEQIAASESVLQSLAQQRVLVEERIRTVKIPTLLIRNRRYDRVVGPEKL